MIFTDEYSKLKNETFTTIRKNSGIYKLNSIIKIKTPSQKFKATVINRVPIKKSDITDEIAWNDADCCRSELISKLEKWYGKEFDDFIFIRLKKS